MLYLFSKIANGIGGLIFVRASISSAMHDSTNFDINRCTAIYERAVARHSSDSSFEDSFTVCDNPQGPNGCIQQIPILINPRRISVPQGSTIIKKKISAPPKLSNDYLVIEDSDAETKSISNYSSSNNNNSNTPVPLKRNYNDRGDMLYWSSNI